MTTGQRNLLAGALFLGLGLCLYEAWIVTRHKARIADLQHAITETRRSELELRQDRDEFQRELDRAPVASPAAPPPSLSVASAATNPPVARTFTSGQARGIVDPRDARILETFVQGFSLSTQETDHLQTAIKEARAQLFRLKADHTRMVEGTGDKSTTATITIEPFPEGDVVREKLEQTFEEVLGEARFAIFRAHYADEYLETVVDGSGRQSRTLAISRFPATYNVMDTKREIGADGRVKSTASMVMVRDLEAPGLRDYREVFAPFVERLKAMPAVQPPSSSQ